MFLTILQLQKPAQARVLQNNNKKNKKIYSSTGEECQSSQAELHCCDATLHLRGPTVPRLQFLAQQPFPFTPSVCQGDTNEGQRGYSRTQTASTQAHIELLGGQKENEVAG